MTISWNDRGRSWCNVKRLDTWLNFITFCCCTGLGITRRGDNSSGIGVLPSRPFDVGVCLGDLTERATRLNLLPEILAELAEEQVACRGQECAREKGSEHEERVGT